MTVERHDGEAKGKRGSHVTHFLFPFPYTHMDPLVLTAGQTPGQSPVPFVSNLASGSVGRVSESGMIQARQLVQQLSRRPISMHIELSTRIKYSGKHLCSIVEIPGTLLSCFNWTFWP